MADENTTQTNEQESSTTQPGDKAGEKVLTFSQDEYSGYMTKEKNAGKLAIMKQFGVADEKDLPGAVSKFNAFLANEAKAEADKPEVERLKGELSGLASVKTDYEKALEKIATFELDAIIRDKGLTDAKEIKLAKYEIRELISAGKEMQDASEEYFKANPVTKKDPPPRFEGGSGTKKNTKPSVDMNKILFGGKK